MGPNSNGLKLAEEVLRAYMEEVVHCVVEVLRFSLVGGGEVAPLVVAEHVVREYVEAPGIIIEPPPPCIAPTSCIFNWS